MDRTEFGQILSSIVIPEGTTVEENNALLRPISKAIVEMMPSSLFRFRPCKAYTLDAFKEDLIYAVPAHWFNDPYDTLARYDLEGIEKGVNSLMSTETIAGLKKWLAEGNDFSDEYKRLFPDGFADALRKRLLSIDDIGMMEERIQETKRMMISAIETYFPILAETSKRFSTIACFCESVDSILMWSHYADSHKGFALEYEFRPTLTNHIANVGLFPVVYDETRVDVSGYVAWAFLVIQGIKTKNPDLLSSLKTALYKSPVWAYEKEWRMIDFSPRDYKSDEGSAIPYKPVAIYYGKEMGHETKMELHGIAKEKGLKEYEMYVDYSGKGYGMGWREVEL